MANSNDNFRELLKGTTPTLILAVLAGGPLHGYAIARAIEQRSSNALSLGEGSLYPTLHSLERDELLTSRWETQASGPARKVYLLTDKGRASLAQRRQVWHDFATAINNLRNASIRSNHKKYSCTYLFYTNGHY